MKKTTLSKSVAPAALCAGLCLAGGALESQAQLTPAQRHQLNGFLGNRAEVGIVLGATDAASGGNYTVDGKNGNDHLEFSLMKFAGGGEVGPARKLGDSDITWHPVVMGAIGYISGENDIDVGPLAFNEFEENALALHLGGGVAFHITERFTVTPTIGVLYGRYEPEINARTPAGFAVDAFLDDETAETIGVTPGIAVAYKVPMGQKMMWDLSARYTFYGTTEISGSDFDAGGSSHVFEQRADLDIPLDASLWDCPLHTGGYFSLTEVAGDISDTMNSDIWATLHGRLLLNTEGKSWAWKMTRIGLGVSGIVGDDFTGWSAGVDVMFKF
jgi:opacity protein-like surface antigen